uniref:Coiled-coil domain containing 106b n=1 Tax=Sinocyclocheilus grahami TaxID=75366 RepID=A0A672PEL1_SINGR
MSYQSEGRRHIPPCSPYLLITSLRAQPQISLEKNSWLQKRIEDLEEERDFLRCQLDRFIFTTKNQESTGMIGKGSFRLYLCNVVSYDDGTESNSSRKCRSGWQNSQTRVKRRRVFRIARSMERQRVKDPAGVLLRYNKILVTYQKLKSMSRAFQVHGVDRNTVASTTPIAEMLLVAPEKVSEAGEFDSSKEKLLDYARRCYKALDEDAHAKVQALKKNNLLLPISYRFRH